MLARLRALALCVLFLSLPSVAVVSAAEVPSDLRPGMYNLTLERTDAPTIHYALQIPENYSRATPVPLVLALHFGGNPQGAGASVLQILVGPALRDLGAIIVAPDSIAGNWSTPDNERAVNDLLDAVIASYAIDENKIAVTGFSMGGAGSWDVAERFPDRFSAVIPVAGRPPASAAGWTLPVFAIHSRDDQVMPYRPTEDRISELSMAGVNAEIILLDGITHYQTNRFQDALRQAVPWLRAVWE